MGPRKRPKPNPQETTGTTRSFRQESGKGTPTQQNPQQEFPHADSVIDPKTPQSPIQACSIAYNSQEKALTKGSKGDSDKAYGDTQCVASNPKLWYRRTWPRISKSLAITQIAKESVSATAISASEPSTDGRHCAKNSPRLLMPTKPATAYFARKMATSNPALPSSAATIELNVSPDSPAQPPDLQVPIAVNLNAKSNEQLEVSHGYPPQSTDLLEVKPISGQQNISPKVKTAFPKSETNSGWLAWLPRTAPMPKNNVCGSPSTQTGNSSSHSGSLPIENSQSAKDVERLPSPRRKMSDASPVASVSPVGQRRSWFTFWSTSSDKQAASVDTCSVQTLTTEQEMVGKRLADSADAQGMEPQHGALGTWGFWSRPKTLGEESQASQGCVDECVASPIAEPKSKGHNSIQERVKLNAQNLSSDALSTNSPLLTPTPRSILKSNIITTSNHGGAAAPVSIAPFESRLQASEVLPASVPGLANILLPQMKATFCLREALGWMQTFSRYLTYNRPLAPKHLSIIRDPPRIKKAIAIGVHGYFPAPLIRSILGQPTGTSIKFADMAEGAIQRWTKHRGYSCDIAKVALEGEGRIGERVDLLWKLMLNWLDDIRKADFIFIACHSQGVPVALILVAKLISFGCINGAHIGVCAMAGVNLGPFSEYRSRWMGGSAGELFEFAKPESLVSRNYNAALRTALSFGVKVVYVGSIDDQLVSLEVRIPTLLLSYIKSFPNIALVIHFWSLNASSHISSGFRKW